MNIQPSPIEPDTTGGQEIWVNDHLPHPSSFFSGTASNDILERIHRLAEDAEDVVLLIGVQGAGKTTLLYRIQSDMPEHWVLCRVDANPMLHPDQLLSRLAHCIDIPLLDDGMAESVAAAFCKLRLQGRLPVVMVDDAEHLPISSLMALMHLHEQRAETAQACALILLAQPDIDRTLTTHQLHAMGTARFARLDLPRLARDETGGYLRHFLDMEGVEVELGFSPEQLAVMHSESGGVPGKLNELVVRALRDAVGPGRESLPERLIRWLRRIPPATALAAGAVTLLLLLTLLFQPQDDSLLQEPAPTAVPISEPPKELRQAEPIPEPGERRVERLVVPPVEEGLYTEDEPDFEASEPKAGTHSDMVESGPTEQNPDLEELPDPAREPPPSATLGTEEAEPPVSALTQPLSKPVQVKPVAGTLHFEREAWLLRQRPETYSLQILAAGDEQSVRNFAQQHRLTTDVYYFVSQRNGRPWIALLLGIYQDRRTAVTVLNMLPDSLRKAGAWPRSLASIQEEIKRAQ